MTQNSVDVPPPVWRAPGMPALLVLTAAGFGGFVALIPVVPLWAVQGGATEAGSGLVNGLLLIVTVMTQPFVPRLLDRFGTGRVLAVGLALLGAPALLLIISDQLAWILTISAVRGIGFGILTVTGSTVVANLVDRAQHGAAVGIYGAAIAVPQIILVPTASFLADTVGFWAVFVIGALPLLGISSAPRLARVLREQSAARDLLPPTDATPVVSVDGGKSERRSLAISLLRPMILLSGVTLAGGALLTFAPQMSSSPAATAGALALLTLSAAITRWSIGGISDRFGAERFLWPLVVISVVGLLAIAAAVRDPNATGILLFLVGMTLLGIAYGGLQNLTLVISLAAVKRKQYGTASAAWNIGFDLGTALGSVLIGTLATAFSFPPAVLAAAAIALLTLPLAFLRGPKVSD
ncbi:MFS transporter [Salinibacterium sp. SWN1162]|uniref:MFS transporter n=1 Tax=Salinibacterium sp. SWN1162 TaxID=2792053 RepID=UPI0027DBA94D|nr:MFS transporter [Salinibacterium sp. SWN1162]